MYNFERNIEKIREIASQGSEIAKVDGQLIPCATYSGCEHCDFSERNSKQRCDVARLLWLLEDDGEPSTERAAGQKEAWELARRITTSSDYGGIPIPQLEEIFGYNWCINDIMAAYNYNEAAKKVKEWEDNKKIKIGDVVRKDACCGVVLRFVEPVHCFGDSSYIGVMTPTGNIHPWRISECIKTGRSLPVEDWMRQIDGEENETED